MDSQPEAASSVMEQISVERYFPTEAAALQTCTPAELKELPHFATAVEAFSCYYLLIDRIVSHTRQIARVAVARRPPQLQARTALRPLGRCLHSPLLTPPATPA